MVKRYISKNISESAVSKRSLDDSFFMGFPMVVLANSGTYYNLEQEIKGSRSKREDQTPVVPVISMQYFPINADVFSLQRTSNRG